MWISCDVTRPCATWLMHVWHDWFWLAGLTSEVRVCDMTHSYMWHDSFICVTWLIHMCDMTHSYVWHDSFICVTWLIHAWKASFVCDMRHVTHLSCVTCPIPMWHDSLWHSVWHDSCDLHMWHDSFNMTHHKWHDSFNMWHDSSYVTWLIVTFCVTWLMRPSYVTWLI